MAEGFSEKADLGGMLGQVGYRRELNEQEWDGCQKTA
jgi:hypothetical protein